MNGALQVKPVDRELVLAELTRRAEHDVDWKQGKILSGLYDPGTDVYDLSVEAYKRFLTPNALYINLYPSLGSLERDVVRSAIELLRGDDQVVGSVTSGGTESILMAVKAARDYARRHRPNVTDPEIVLPVTAHPAFHKAAHYLGVRTVVTPVDRRGFRADVAALRDAVSTQTILLVGSVPNFSHGTIDPIAEMAAVARQHNVLLHVDACVGGFYLSFLRRMGDRLPDFDFSVPGVTSISADLHKYAYAPKNSSVVLYRDRELRRAALFVCTKTTEYAVINFTAQSSRSGGPIASAWAVMRHLGEEGYARIVRASQDATRRMLQAIDAIAGIEVLGDPEMCMFTLGSDTVNIFEVDDEMRARGWNMVPQFACGGSPANLHVSVSWSNVAHVGRFLTDLAEVVEGLRTRGSSLDHKALAEAVSSMKGKSLEEIFATLAPLANLGPEGVPERMAALNTMLDMLPADTRDDLLAAWINMMS